MNIKSPDIKDIPSLRTLWKEAFSDTDEFLDVFFSTAFSQNRSFCIEENGEITAALYTFDCLYNGGKIAYIYAVATLKGHRGKGLCKKLMEYTHTMLKRAGYKGAILVPSSSSLFDFYAKIGYKTCCYLSTKDFSAGEFSEPVTQISAEEFSALRRKFLKKGGVIQEDENLTLLSTYADFYKGEDFLFAASIEEDSLICHEYLGNTEKAAGILKPLGCKNGKLRTAGMETPFAMYLPFEGNDYPTYLGFAFD